MNDAPEMPENIRGTIVQIALMVGQHPHPRAGDIGRSIEDLCRAIAAALLKERAAGIEHGAAANPSYAHNSIRSLRAQADALEAEHDAG